MIQLSYQAAFDPFNAVFRFLRLLELFKPGVAVERDAFRIMDFYLSFPYRISEMRMAQTHKGYKKLSTEYAFKKPYGDLPESVIIFNRMQPMQGAALNTLATYKFIDADKLNVGWIVSASEEVPAELSKRVRDANAADERLMTFLGILGADYPLVGPSGLKERTGLMEYRYDAI